MTKLSIGIQTFRKLREGGYAYADKTSLIERLTRDGQMYFLARPRRFGKSLLVTTLADAFAGHRELFTGLHLETHWDWERCHPVLRLDFGEGILSTTALLDATVALQLAECAQVYGVTLTQEPIHLRLHELIHALHVRTGERAVVLVDEYDKPILDHLDRPEVALALRESLRNLYSVLKSQDAHLRFVLLTGVSKFSKVSGVSKFSKVSLFSGLNNLEDITLDSRYATLCGYTQSELENAFADHLAGVDLAEVKQWYNGYNFLGESVYNPFDVLLYLRNRELRPWWFETGTPTFLIKLLQTRRYHIPDLENLETGEELLGTFDVDRIEPEALLFQTGYLTIRERYRRSGLYRYRLRYPNFEVRTSLPTAILNAYVPSVQDRLRTEDRIYAALEADEPDGLYRAFHAFFASIPHDWHRRNAIADYEGYWASVVYCYFAALGLAVTPEDATNRGRIDLSIRFAERVYLLEFKVVESSEAGGALEQLRARGYAEKFAGLPVTLIGMEFSREQRNLVGFEWARG